MLLTASRLPAPAAADWIAAPTEPRPISREQFVEAIRAGLQLFYSFGCENCDGKGWLIVKPYIDFSQGSQRKDPGGKRECLKCKGVGRIPIPSIKR